VQETVAHNTFGCRVESDADMNIIHISHMVEKDGSSLCLLDIIDFELRRGDHVLVTVQKDSGFLIKELTKRGVPYSVIPFRFNCYPQTLCVWDFALYPMRFVRDRIVNVIAYWRLSKASKLFNPGLIHTNNGITDVGYRLAKRYQLPHVWHLRECQGRGFGTHPFPSMRSLVSKLKDPDTKVVCVSCYVRDNFGLGDKAYVIYDGVRRLSQVHVGVREKERYFVFVGQLTYEKGLDDVIGAFIEYRQQGGRSRLLVAGGTLPWHVNFVEEQKNRLKNAGLQSAVEFLGVRDDVDQLLQRAEAVIVASRQEGFGRVAPEAMMNGCLVVGRNCTGTAEVLHASGSGILFDEFHQLVAAMLAISGMSADEMRRACLEAQEHAVKMFVVEECTKAYGSVCGK